MGVTLQVAEVKVNLLMRKFMLLGLELEEFFAVHDSSSRRTSSGTPAAARGKRDTYMLSVHKSSYIESGFTLCFGTKAFGRLHSGSSE